MSDLPAKALRDFSIKKMPDGTMTLLLRLVPDEQVIVRLKETEAQNLIQGLTSSLSRG